MPDLSAVGAVLTKLGFVEHPDHPVLKTVPALSVSGPFVVHGTWSKGDHIVHVEQNTVNNPDGSADTFAPVLVIEDTSTGGRVAANLHDLDAMATLLSGQRDFNENGDSADPTGSKIGTAAPVE